MNDDNNNNKQLKGKGRPKRSSKIAIWGCMAIAVACGGLVMERKWLFGFMNEMRGEITTATAAKFPNSTALTITGKESNDPRPTSYFENKNNGKRFNHDDPQRNNHQNSQKETSQSSRHPHYYDHHLMEFDPVQQIYRIRLSLNFDTYTYTYTTPNLFCVPWQVDSDLWWTHHREWQASFDHDNDTHYCFQPVLDATKKQFFRDLYQIQFPASTDVCQNNLTIKPMWNFGWGADLINLVQGLHHALMTYTPFQVNESTPWHYAISKRNVDSSNPIKKRACPQQNMYCYFLNMSSCSSMQFMPANHTQTQSESHKLNLSSNNHYYLYHNQHYRWYMEYMVRPQTWLRRRVYQFLQHHVPPIETPCTVMHVRRNDVVLHNQQARKYHPIADYLNATTTSARTIRKNILLLTDDANAIGEAVLKFPHYHWMYLDRPRFRGVGAWEHQIPSDNPILEVVVLLSIFQLVRHCDQIVLSTGKFSEYLYEEMTQQQNLRRRIERVNIDEGQSDVLAGANSNTHVISHNYYDAPATPNLWGEKQLTVGGMRIVGSGEVLPRDKEVQSHDFCLGWDINADDWWMHHPTFGPGPENGTHYCFQPITDRSKAAFLKELYRLQFLEGDCRRGITQHMTSVSWSADLEHLANGLAHAKRTRVPFQVGTEHWHYADLSVVRQNLNGSTPTNAMACHKRNMFCYFLEFSRCPPLLAKTSESSIGLGDSVQTTLEYPWLLQYLTRPQTWLRKKVFDFVARQSQKMNFATPCAVLHVDRDDDDAATLIGDHFHKHRKVQDYYNIMKDAVERKNVTLPKNIFLVTNDASAIEEAKRAFFSGYNWMHLDRPCNTNKDSDNFPSNDPVFEVVVLQSLFRMVKQCDQLIIHSSSSSSSSSSWTSSSSSNHLKLAQLLEWEMKSTGQAITVVNIVDEGTT